MKIMQREHSPGIFFFWRATPLNIQTFLADHPTSTLTTCLIVQMDSGSMRKATFGFRPMETSLTKMTLPAWAIIKCLWGIQRPERFIGF